MTEKQLSFQDQCEHKEQSIEIKVEGRSDCHYSTWKENVRLDTCTTCGQRWYVMNNWGGYRVGKYLNKEDLEKNGKK